MRKCYDVIKLKDNLHERNKGDSGGFKEIKSQRKIQKICSWEKSAHHYKFFN